MIERFAVQEKMFVEKSGKIAGLAGKTEQDIGMMAVRRILREIVKILERILLTTVELEVDCDGRHCSCRSSSS